MCCMFVYSPHYLCFVALSRFRDLFLSRLINEEIKVSVSQSRHKDTGKWGGGN